MNGIKKISVKILAILINKIYKIFNLSKKHKYKYFSILIPADHALPEYKKIHKNYDRFLPHLVKYFNSGKYTVVDIGANIGDSLAGMIEKNSKLNFICIEADNNFYDYLKKNLQIIKQNIKNAKVKIIKEFIGKNITNVFLNGKNGTKKAEINKKKGDIKCLPLDKILSNVSNIRLIKTDTDGFDYDVLNSSISIIKKNLPLIFFEYQFENKYKIYSYLKTFKLLEKIGYCDWVIFDNYGTIILRTNQLKIIEKLTNYINLQNNSNATRTILYFDILTCINKDSKFIDKILNDYHPKSSIN
jgi:FkbM family methyltransferase